MSLTPEQQALRLNGIGSSMVPSIVGANQYRSPFQLWQELVGEVPPFTGNFDTRMGSALEPVIAEEYAAIYKREIFKGETVRHPDYDWAFATPDYIAKREDGAAIILEIKNCRFKAKAGGEHDSRPSFRLQVAWQMACRNLIAGEVFIHCMAGRKEERFEIIPVERDRQLEQALITHCKRFWFDHVLTKVPPPEGFPLAA